MKYYTALIADINHPILDTLVDGAKEGKILVETAKSLGHKYIITAGEETGTHIKGFLGLAASSIDQIEDAVNYVSKRMHEMKLPTGEWAVSIKDSKDDYDAVYNLLKNKFNTIELKN